MIRSRCIRSHETQHHRLPRLAERIPGLAASAFALALTLLVSTPPASASTVTVPDDFATIQQAVDSGAEEILIRPGTYAETPVITRPLSIRGLVPGGAPGDALPVIAGLVFDDLIEGFTHTQHTNINDLRFSGAVQNAYNTNPYSGPYVLTFSNCVLDAGVNDSPASVGGQLEYEFHHCTFNGPITLGYPDRIWIDDCRVRHPITMTMLHYRLSWFTLTNSRVSGSGAVGVNITGRADEVIVQGNTFEGYEVPLQYFGSQIEVVGNTFTGPGRYAVQTRYDGTFARNTIIGYDVGLFNDGGDGFVRVLENRIENCTTAGIKVDGYDIECERDTVISCGTGMILSASYELTARANVVRSCGSDGMSIRTGQGLIESNLVGRCGGHGIAATLSSAYGWPVMLRGNTSYLNGASGYSLALSGASRPNEVDHNIAYFNRAHGLRVTTSDPLTLGCNDWFANESGPADGIDPAGSDLAVDPRFCDLANDNAQLAADSPLLDAPGCGLIGALGQGCEAVPMAISFELAPATLSLASRGHWVTAFLEPAPPFAASDIDVALIRLNETVPVDPAAQTALGDHDGDGVLDLMVKFDRVALELTLPESDNVPVSVTGTVGGRSFLGTSTIRVRREAVSTPAAGSHQPAGSVTQVRWQTPIDVTVPSVALFFSRDAGGTWSVIGRGQPNTGSYDWTVPGVPTDQAEVAVVLESADETGNLMMEGVLAMSAAFSIEASLGVGNRGPGQSTLAIRGTSPNPAPSGRFRVEFALPDGSPARLELLDVAGRVLASRQVGAMGPGAHSLDLVEGSSARPGIYFLRLTQGGSEVRARAAIVR